MEQDFELSKEYNEIKETVMVIIKKEINDYMGKVKKFQESKETVKLIDKTYNRILEILKDEINIENNKKELKECTKKLIHIFTIILYNKVLIFDYKFFSFFMVNCLMKDEKEVEKIICFLLTLK